MKVVVTGGSGQLGQAVISELIAHGHEVLCLDRKPHPQGFRPSWTVDLLNVGSLYEACAGASAIIHLAAHIAPNLVKGHEPFCLFLACHKVGRNKVHDVEPAESLFNKEVGI